LILVYLCDRKGLPSLDAQREACRAAGASEAELADAYMDTGKPKRGEPAQPQRDYMPGSARKGDVVMVARLAVLATTKEDALRFVSAISAQGVPLHDASTGRRYSVRPEAAQDVADALSLAADIEADEAKARMEKARRGKKGKTGGRPSPSPERMEAAKPLWFNHALSTEEVEARTGIGQWVLRRAFGPRGTPAFGKALQKMRNKT
jgi:DNA invertase Pin-like site-specific DNA recombinase